jgi:PKD repeat protein
MSEASAPPAKTSVAKRGFGLLKLAFGGAAGLATGVIGVYATAIVDKVAKPPKPVANFSVAADGLTVTCNNLASGQTGWWDFGDGATLEPFNPDEKQVTHTYEKAGSYSVKLVVRNFLNEENDRAVGVDVTSGAKATGGPAVTSLTVEPIGNGTAPATFRVKGVVQNAQNVIFDAGDKAQQPECLPAGGGTFERLVVFEQPDRYPVQLFAMTGGKVHKVFQTVDVKAPPAGSLSVVLKVTDSGTKVERRSRPETVLIRVPEKPTGGFEKGMLPDAGFTLAEAKLGTVTSKAVKNVKAEMDKDRKSVKVSGEWTGTVEAVNRAAGGSDVMIPLTLTQEKATAYSGTPQSVAAPLAFAGSFSLTSDDWTSGTLAVTLKLPDPPAGVVNLKRAVALELHEMTAKGGKPQDLPIGRVPELTKPVEEYVVKLSNGEQRVLRSEKVSENQLKVTVRPQAGAGSRAGR